MKPELKSIHRKDLIARILDAEKEKASGEPETAPSEPDTVTEPDTTTEPEKPHRPGRNPFRRPEHVEPGQMPKPKAVLTTEAELDPRIHPSVRQKLRSREHPLGALSSYPATREGELNFEELLASSRFAEVAQKLEHYTGEPVENIGQLAMGLMEVLEQIISVENGHREELFALAKRIVMEDFGIKEGQVQFELHLNEDIETQDFRVDPDKVSMEDMPPETLENLGDVAPELEKRRIINAMIHGAAEKGQYLYHLIEQELSAIDPELTSKYGMVMSMNDVLYWVTGEEMIMAAHGSGSSFGGKSSVDADTEPPTVIAYGVTFPILVHEMVKGVMELLSLHGLPKDKAMQKYVMSKADFLNAEQWDLRLGPGLWQKFLDMIDAEDYEVKSHLYAEVAAMPVREFQLLVKELLNGTPKGKKMLSDLAQEIRKDIAEEGNE